MTPFQSPAVAAKFESYPPPVRGKLLHLREMVFEVARDTHGVGLLEETLKWGEPAYLTTASGSGSTVRMDWKKSKPAHYALYFNCNTRLVDTFRTLFVDDFVFEGNRAIVLKQDAALPADALRFCIAAALTYHLGRPSSPSK